MQEETEAERMDKIERERLRKAEALALILLQLYL
jgi:hypothetical protein